MLILTRKEGESLHLFLHPDTPHDLTAHELFAAGPIVVTLAELRDSGGARLGIEAPAGVVVLREELMRYHQDNIGA